MHIAIGADTSKYILRSCALHDDIPTCLVTKNGTTCQGNVGMSCGPQMIAVGWLYNDHYIDYRLELMSVTDDYVYLYIYISLLLLRCLWYCVILCSLAFVKLTSLIRVDDACKITTTGWSSEWWSDVGGQYTGSLWMHRRLFQTAKTWQQHLEGFQDVSSLVCLLLLKWCYPFS